MQYFSIFLLSFASHALIHAPNCCWLHAEQFHWKFRGLKNRSSWWYGKNRKTSSEHDKLCQFCVFISRNHSAASLQLSFTQKHRFWFGARDKSQSGRTAERWIFEKRSNRRRTSNYTWIYTIIVGYEPIFCTVGYQSVIVDMVFFTVYWSFWVPHVFADAFENLPLLLWKTGSIYCNLSILK